MSDTTTTQIQQINTLLQTLQNNINTTASAINSTLTSQSQIITNMSSNITQIEQNVLRINENMNKTSNIISEIAKIKIDVLSKTSTKVITDNLEKVAESVEVTNDTINSVIEYNNDLNKNIIQNNTNIQENIREHLKTALANTRQQSETLDEQSNAHEKFINQTNKLSDTLRDLPFIGEKLGQILDNKLQSIGGFLDTVLSSIKSVISLATDFVKLTFTLPFSILSRANEIGKEFRRVLVEGVGQTLEDFKDKFDLSSYVGKSVKSMVDNSVEIMKQFEDPANDMVKLFGFREEGMKAYAQELATTLIAMGSYAEVFAGTFRNNQKNYKQFILLKREMSYQDEDISYFAMDAAVNLKGLNQRIFEASSATNAIAKEYNIDQKMLSKNFMTLRKDVILFGHLTDEELNNTAAVMTRLKVKMEDAVAVFNKFSTFEDAANSVAILSQTFGMNLNALDIIKAEKPEEIFSMFRNAMLDTGRTFDDLSRFEKSIMTQQTGMSAESLKAMMNYTASGLTFDEARKKLEESSPEKQQIKTLKELQSAIKELKKVLEFQSPFEAIFKGLSANIAYDKDTRNMFMMLSGNYETIYKYFLNMPSEQISKIVDPLLLIVDIMKGIFADPSFINTIKILLEGFGNLLTFSFGLQDDVYLKELKSGFKNQLEITKKSKKEKPNFKEFNELLQTNQGITKPEKFKGDDEKLFNILLRQLEKNQDILKKDKILIYEELHKLQNYTVPKEISDNAKTVVEQTSGAIQVAAAKSENALNTMTDMSKMIAGIMIRGAMTGITALLKAINDMLVDANLFSNNESLFEKLTGISGREFNDMFKELKDAFSNLFTWENIKSSFNFTGEIIASIKDSFFAIGVFLAEIIKSAFIEVFTDKKQNAPTPALPVATPVPVAPVPVAPVPVAPAPVAPAPVASAAPAAPAPAAPAPAAPAATATNDFWSDMSSKLASPMTILGKENKPVDFSSAKGVVNYNSGFVSMILEKSNMMIDDVKNVDNSMRDFYDSTSNVDLSKKNVLRQKIEELSLKLSSKDKEKNDETIIIKPEIDRDGIRQLAKALIGDNFAQMLTMPHLTQGVASINSSILNSPTLNTGEFNAAHTYSYNKG